MNDKELSKFRWPFLLLLVLFYSAAACIDQSADTEINTVVYQFADISIGDTIPQTSMVWTMLAAQEVMRRVDGMVYSTWSGWTLSECHRYGIKPDRTKCLAARFHELSAERDRYILELQILGYR